MATNAEIIWSYLIGKGLTPAGAAGLLGNLFCESSLMPNNMGNAWEGTYNDITYTEQVNRSDHGFKNTFINDGVDYGLAQWTYSTRKKKMYEYIRENRGGKIDDLTLQLDYLWIELNESYSSVLSVLKTTNSVREASNKVLLEFEIPGDRGTTVQDYRAQKSTEFYNQLINYSENSSNDTVIIPNIELCTNTNATTYSPNRNIRYLVVHYTAGSTSNPGSAKYIAQGFASANASADFVVDDTAFIQYNPDLNNRYCWHCGDGNVHPICRNENSIGIEICSSNDNFLSSDQPNSEKWYFTDTVINQAVILIQYLMSIYNIPYENVIRHYDVSGKLCPGVVGWNPASGSEEKWFAFKTRLTIQQNTITQLRPLYLWKITSETNCYINMDEGSEVKVTYYNQDIASIYEENNNWGRTDDGWILLNTGHKISASEGVTSKVFNGYDEFNESGKSGYEYIMQNENLKPLFELRERENKNGINVVMSTSEFIKNLAMSLENCNGDKEFYEQQMKLVMKSTANTNKSLVETSFSDLLINTVSNAFTTITDEEIENFLKDEDNKQKIIDYYQENYDENGWNKQIADSPETLNFWFDFMDTNGEIGKYAAQVIGNRPKAVNNDKVSAIYFQETPSVLFMTDEDYQQMENNKTNYADMTGYTFVRLQPFMENYFTISAQGKSAKDELDNLLYQHTYATEQVNLTSMPLYYLQPNTRIMVKDDNTGINGEYIVSKVTVPLQYNGTTSITATKAVERIY